MAAAYLAPTISLTACYSKYPEKNPESFRPNLCFAHFLLESFSIAKAPARKCICIVFQHVVYLMESSSPICIHNLHLFCSLCMKYVAGLVLKPYSC